MTAIEKIKKARARFCLSRASHEILDDLDADGKTLGELRAEALNHADNYFEWPEDAFEYLSNNEISDLDAAVEDGRTEIRAIASFYLRDEIERVFENAHRMGEKGKNKCKTKK